MNGLDPIGTWPDGNSEDNFDCAGGAGADHSQSVAPARQAEADGGVTIAIGVGAFLLADALVGRECGREEWPLNIIRKIGDELHGRPGCHRGRNYHEGHRRHHAPNDKLK